MAQVGNYMLELTKAWHKNAPLQEHIYGLLLCAVPRTAEKVDFTVREPDFAS